MDDWRREAAPCGCSSSDASGPRPARPTGCRPRLAVARAGPSPRPRRSGAWSAACACPDGDTYLLFLPAATMPPLERFLMAPVRRRRSCSSSPVPSVSLAFGALLAWYVARPIRHLRGPRSRRCRRGRLETRVAPLIGRPPRRGRRPRARLRPHGAAAPGPHRRPAVAAPRRLPRAALAARAAAGRHRPRAPEPAEARGLPGADRARGRAGGRAGGRAADPLAAGGDGGRRSARAARSGSTSWTSSRRSPPTPTSKRRRAAAPWRFTGEGELVAEVRGRAPAPGRRERRAQRGQVHGPGDHRRGDRGPRAGPPPSSSSRVADRGPGVAEAELETIFEPFYRGAGEPGRASASASPSPAAP